MTYHRRRRTDHNQPAIVAALRENGAQVLDLSAVGSGVPDLLALLPGGRLALIEVKNLEGRGRRFTPEQVEFHRRWPVHVITSEAEALALLDGAGRFP